MAADAVDLACGPLTVCLDPLIGGTIAAFRLTDADCTWDILRPTRPGSADPRETACFPLVPFSNRIPGGRFAWRGSVIELPCDMSDPRHALHGHGWRAPWEIIARSGDSATLLYEHFPDSWPWAYSVRQEFQLSAETLSINLSITNDSLVDMPAGIGLHPYFPRVSGMRLRTQAAGVLLHHVDETPREILSPLPPEFRADHDGLSFDGRLLNNCFTGWHSPAILEWPDRPFRLHIEADDIFGHLVVYSPEHQDYVCIEPVSNLTDAFNLAALGHPATGMAVLPPDETLLGRIVLRIERCKV